MNQPQLQGPQQQEMTIDLKQLIGIVMGQRWLAVTIVAVCFALAALFAWRMPPIYQSNVLVQVNNDVSGTSMLSDLSMNPLGGKMGKASPAQIQTALIHSEFILNPTVEALHLDISAKPHYFPFIGARLASRYDEDGIAKAPLGLTKYAWGGENIEVTKLTVPAQYYNKRFILTAGKNGAYKLADKSGSIHLNGRVGELATYHTARNGDITILVHELAARPGTQFYATKLPLDSVVKSLSGQLQIKDLGTQADTGILQMSMSGPSAAILPTQLNTIANNTVQKNIEKKSEEASKTLEIGRAHV